MTFENFGGSLFVVKYDEAGNLICETRYGGDKVVYENEYTYIALELPLDYVQANESDPAYPLVLW